MKNILAKILLLILFTASITAQAKTTEPVVQTNTARIERTTEVGISLIKYFEGLRLKTYRCSAGVLTIGIGHTGSDVFANQLITKVEAVLLLKKDLRRFENYVDKVAVRNIKWHEFDALVCFSFNLGYRIDAVMKEAINRSNTKLVLVKILRYNKAKVNGSYIVLNGLMKRRQAEAALYQNKLSNSMKLAII